MGKGNKRFRNGIDLKQMQNQFAKKQPPGMKGFVGKVQEQKIHFDEYIQSPSQERYGKLMDLQGGQPQEWKLQWNGDGFVQAGPGNRTLNIYPKLFPAPFDKFVFVEVGIDLNQKIISVAYSYPGMIGRQMQWTVMPDTTEEGVRNSLYEAGRNLHAAVNPYA